MKEEKKLWYKIAEECVEMAHVAMEAARFGVEHKKPGQEFTNLERLLQESLDLGAAMEKLNDIGVVSNKIEDEVIVLWERRAKLRLQEYLDEKT